MQIGGFVKQSLIDYPGKIAAVVFTQGCNFRCGYCHNPQLVLPKLFHKKSNASIDEVFNYLKKRKNWLDGVVVTGGEPTIHSDLPDFLKEINRFGLAIKLDTNGSNPIILDYIIRQKLVNFVAMDIKTFPEASSYAKIIGLTNTDNIIDNVISSILLLKQSGIEYEFRTTSIPEIHNKEILELIKNYIGNDTHYKINEFRQGDTINSYT